MAHYSQQTFTATTSSGFTVPAGVTTIFVSGCGSGGSGASGSGGLTSNPTTAQLVGSSGGGGAPYFSNIPIAVTPGNVLDITVGLGVTGPNGGASATVGSNGTDGNSSSINIHGGATLVTFIGGGKGWAAPNTSSTSVFGSGFIFTPGGTVAGASTVVQRAGSASQAYSQITLMYQGGFGGDDPTNNTGQLASAGGSNWQGFTGGGAGSVGTITTNLPGCPGAGGGCGGNATANSQAAGGNAGNGSATTGGVGAGGKRFDGSASSAALNSNTGSGGGAGGGGGNGTTGGAGGAGGGSDSGVIIIGYYLP